MKQYLVIQVARFGDLVQTKRLIASLTARGDGDVHVLVDNSLKSLAESVYPQAVIHGIAAHATALDAKSTMRAILIDNRKAFDDLASIGFDEVYNLNFSPLGFRIAALFDPETVHGHRWKNGQEIIPEWAAMAMRWTGNRRLGINIADFWAAYTSPMLPGPQINPPAHPKGGGPGIVLAGRESRRSLPPQELAAVTAVLAARHPGPVLLLGSASEASTGREVMNCMPTALRERTRNLAGKTDWKELVEIVDSLDVLVTPDTGTMHLAAHLGTPVQAFFLSSAWCFETGPYGEGHTVYQAVQDCLPCLETAPCPYRIKCLAPFSDSAFPRFIATGKPETLPQGVTVFETAFDPLGLTFRPTHGIDMEQEARGAFRRFLGSHLGVWDGAIHPFDTTLAEQLHQPKDWTTKPNKTVY
jgi:ADP-heptose:LPS heptosyltransferase